MYFRVQFLCGTVKYFKANSFEQMKNFICENELEDVDTVVQINQCDSVDYDISSKKIGRYYV